MFRMRFSIVNRVLFWESPAKFGSFKLYNDMPFDDIPDVSATLIKKVLRSNNLQFDDGYACFITACPTCSKSTKNALSCKVYINKTTGFFSCPSCKSMGNWNTFEAYMDTKKSKKTIDGSSSEAERIKEHLNDIRSNTLELKAMPGLQDVLEKFKLPVVPESCLENLDIRVDESQSNIYFPLENVLSQVVGYQTLKRTSNQLVMPYCSCSGVLTGKSSKSKDTAILVPNISDFLSLVSAKVSGNVICLPNGARNLPQYVLPSFERFNKLVLWFGNEAKSWDSARNFAKKLGEKRCLFIRPIDKQSLPHLCDSQNYKAIISAAQPIWHKSITSFASLRQDVLSDLQNIDKVQGVKWKRYPALNRILKGHRKGELTVLTGPTGCGKTTFMSEYSLDLALQGVNTLWGSFEIRNARLARTMLQQMVGCPLDENLDKFDSWADAFELLPLYFMNFHGQQSTKVVMEAVEHATYVHDIEHVIIDNVQFMMGMSEDQRNMDRFWKQDTIIAAFRTFATRKNCHVTLVVHPRKERMEDDLTTSSIFGGAKASQEADNVLIIQDKRLTSLRGKKYLQVSKNRYSGDLGVMALDFDKSSLGYAQKRKKNEEKVSSDFKDHQPNT